MVSWSYSPAIDVDDPFQRQALECIAGRFLLGGAFVRAGSRPEWLAAQDGLDDEFPVVGRAGCLDSAVAGRDPLTLLDQFLEAALVVGCLALLDPALGVGLEEFLDEAPRGCDPSVEVDRAEDGLQRAG